MHKAHAGRPTPSKARRALWCDLTSAAIEGGDHLQAQRLAHGLLQRRGRAGVPACRRAQHQPPQRRLYLHDTRTGGLSVSAECSADSLPCQKVRQAPMLHDGPATDGLWPSLSCRK